MTGESVELPKGSLNKGIRPKKETGIEKKEETGQRIDIEAESEKGRKTCREAKSKR